MRAWVHPGERAPFSRQVDVASWYREPDYWDAELAGRFGRTVSRRLYSPADLKARWVHLRQEEPPA